MTRHPVSSPDDEPADAGVAQFHALLERLIETDASAGSAYESLRRRVIVFFRHHLPIEAEALADTVLDRLARRIADRVEIADLRLYALGIARNVLSEAHTRAVQHDRALADPTFGSHDADNAVDEEVALATLRLCLARFAASQKHLILSYYNGDGAQRIRTRRELAAANNVTLNTLRNRALRLRAQLETCMRQRLGAQLAA
jgi:DNA-directed RNA polymerase specialized sigma24 family protein